MNKITDFELGLIDSLILSIILVLAISKNLVQNRKHDDDFYWIKIIIFSISVPLIIYPFVNLILNILKSVEENRIFVFLEKEFSQIIVWRITSIWLGLESLALHKVIIIWKYSLYDPIEKYYKQFPELINLSQSVPIEEIVAEIYLSRLFYLFSLSFLGIHYIGGGDSYSSAVLAFSIFFIFDDWNIVSFYFLALKGRRRKFHTNRIDFFNFLIFLSTILVLNKEFKANYLGIILAVNFVFIFLAYLLLYFTRRIRNIRKKIAEARNKKTVA
ncbi:hypothetical protein CH372_19370 [Leptospira meyeri]|uniref:hypothetical protein n=1 Tax=Leptospira meyeri TaxID=29508 RepID=UPI000C2ADF9A|nr:hypothetical protein [Leptospira meyeri]PKA10442.1 hypothetical protein CH372_19370 [Leptospira meyeri]